MTDDDIIQAAPHLVECDRTRAEHGTPCGCITRDVVAAVRPLITAENEAAIKQAQQAYIDAHPETRKPQHWDTQHRDFHGGVVDGFTLAARAVGVGGQHTDTPPAGIDIRKVAESPPPPDFDWAALNAIDGRDVGAGTPEATNG